MKKITAKNTIIHDVGCDKIYNKKKKFKKITNFLFAEDMFIGKVVNLLSLHSQKLCRKIKI